MRNRHREVWWPTAAVVAAASALAGLTLGFLLGLVGSMIEETTRIGLATLLGVVAAGLGIVELAGTRLHPLQWNRETPQRWVDEESSFRWAIRNGFALGSGAMSRIGYWAWYVVPIGSLLTGSAEAGAALYGTYGVVRGLTVWAIVAGLARRPTDDFGDWLMRQGDHARHLAASQLFVVGTVVVAVVGP